MTGCLEINCFQRSRSKYIYIIEIVIEDQQTQDEVDKGANIASKYFTLGHPSYHRNGRY